MISGRMRSALKENWVFYFIGFIIVFGVKYFLASAGSDELGWVLAPTAQWVRVLSGMRFEREPGLGYINHDFRFVIAASCSGVQFMLITFATFLYSFVHRMKTKTGGFCWVGLSLAAAYLFTIFVNGFRIVLSIYLYRLDVRSGWLTPERLHTTAGTAIYFVSLLLIYHLAEKITRTPEKGQAMFKCVSPAFWYLSITLAIPFLNRAYRNSGGKFAEYAALVTVVSLSAILLYGLAAAVRKRLEKRALKHIIS